MTLDEYQRKRRFAATPEPPARVEAGAGHRFVVQKHRASHLHYDFRLEMDGVLKSWAVPKGPSMDPADKRLAMMVEDHPVSYFDFEGVIPPGNYGAGTVMVWDWGTWDPMPPDGGAESRSARERDHLAAALLTKGDLKFVLHGEKLKGSFVLAHIRSRRPGSKGNEWLLIKHRDGEAVSGYDIDRYDYSVRSGRSLEAIAADAGSAEWQSNRAAVVNEKNAWLKESIARHDQAAASSRAQQGSRSRPDPPNAAKSGAGEPIASPPKTSSQSRKDSAKRSTAAGLRSSRSAESAAASAKSKPAARRVPASAKARGRSRRTAS